MYSFRRLAVLLALVLSATLFVRAQNTGSSSSSAADPAQSSTSQAAPVQSQPQLSVQSRIKARREQRRAAAIHETYDHLYEGYIGAGYLRFRPGSALQRVNEYNWNGGFTRYFNERLGATVDGRGYYGTPFIRPEQGDPPAGDVGLTKPAISQYSVLFGPTYRFYLQPKYSISARGLAGYAHGNFTGDTNGYGTLGVLYPDSSTFAISASVFAEYNLAPNLGFRVAPEYYVTGFGSSVQSNLGFTAGIVYRVGKQ